MMMKTIVFSMAVVCLMITGCGQKSEKDKSEDNSGKIKTIGMSQCNLGEPWRVQMNADVKKAAGKFPNVKVVFKDAQNDSLSQVAQIEEFINAEVDAIIVSPKEAAPLTPVIKAAF